MSGPVTTDPPAGGPGSRLSDERGIAGWVGTLAAVFLVVVVVAGLEAVVPRAVTNTVLAALQRLDPHPSASVADIADGDLWHPVQDDWQILRDLFREAQEIHRQEQLLRERKLGGENVDNEWSRLQERRKILQERLNNEIRRLRERRERERRGRWRWPWGRR
jgi:hypothetical protein